MEDAISVTVIATGFNADGQLAKKKLEAANDSVFAPEKKETVSATTQDKTDDDDDTFYDIMSIFNK
jgi:cell division protein FtsZ